MQVSFGEITINELRIDRAEALRYLRLPAAMRQSELPADILQQLAEAEAAVLRAAEPRFIWREFTLTETAAGLSLNDTALLLPGADIARLLADSQKCLLLAATVGIGIDELIRRAEITDMGRALILDAMASAAVENLCDQIQAALAARYAQKRLYLTRRFSPGYGDLPIDLQKSLCATLDCGRRIGLSVSASGIMLPRKSVTAIIGLTNAPAPPPKQTHNCAECNLRETCPYRRAGVTCGEPE